MITIIGLLILFWLATGIAVAWMLGAATDIGGTRKTAGRVPPHASSARAEAALRRLAAIKRQQG